MAVVTKSGSKLISFGGPGRVLMLKKASQEEFIKRVKNAKGYEEFGGSQGGCPGRGGGVGGFGAED